MNRLRSLSYRPGQVILAEKHGLKIVPSVATNGSIASGSAVLVDVS